MKIAICDDDLFLCEFLQNTLKQYMSVQRLLADIVCFHRAEELLSSSDIFDLIFLDYQLDVINGLEAALKLRLQNFIGSIIFITSYPEFVFDSFQVNPFRFLRKPLTANAVSAVMDAYLEQFKQNYPLILAVGGTCQRINSRDILYVEADGKYSIVNKKGEQLHCSKTLRQIYELLPTHTFFRVHRSYIVNFNYISTIDKKAIRLENGNLIYISRSQYKNVVQSYHNFIHNSYIRM